MVYWSMELETAFDLALNLMTQHGLTKAMPNYWHLKFDNAVRRLGQTNFATHTISLSKPCTLAATDPAQVRNTILHEIAHALVGPRHGHDSTWRLKAVSIGCNGQRCTDSNPIQGKYKIKCLACNTAFGNYVRVPKQDRLAYQWHRRCGREAIGKLQVVANEAIGTSI